MSDCKFACPHCNQHLEASPDMLGQTIECPSCQGKIAIPSPTPHARAAQTVAPPTLPPAEQAPGTCPLCGKDKHMSGARMLYGQLVCRKCYYAFANQRQLAYFVDLLGLYALTFVAGAILGLIMTATGSAPRDIQSMGSVLGYCLLPFFICKDGFSGYSLGKLMCGVRVIDETTGEPGGFGASFKRNLPILIPFVPLVIAFQLCKGHRTGDGWSNTKVIWKKYASHPIFAPTRP